MFEPLVSIGKSSLSLVSSSSSLLSVSSSELLASEVALLYEALFLAVDLLGVFNGDVVTPLSTFLGFFGDVLGVSAVRGVRGVRVRGVLAAPRRVGVELTTIICAFERFSLADAPALLVVRVRLVGEADIA